MKIAHLTASPFYGGPERQMLGLARHLPATISTLFLSFSEGGRCRPFLAAARRAGFEAEALENDTPRLRAAVRELTGRLAGGRADVLFCHGYKANLLGRVAARRLMIPAVAVSRGWTGESWKVRLYEAADRKHLRLMDCVVCVSAAQAAKVYRAGVRPGRIRVIHNAVDPGRFATPDPRGRVELQSCFRERRSLIVGAAGRLSPEKGFEVLVAAARRLREARPSAGVVLFGEGSCRERLERRIAAEGLGDTFVLGGFRGDLDRLLPHFDLLVLPSYTEGLPNVVLEACAAGVPVVATAVGGTPEVLGAGGVLVPPGDPVALAAGIESALARGDGLWNLGEAGRRYVSEHFSFAAQARRYLTLLDELLPQRPEVWPLRTNELVPSGLTCEA